KSRKLIVILIVLAIISAGTLLIIRDNLKAYSAAKSYLQTEYPGFKFKVGFPVKPFLTSGKYYISNTKVAIDGEVVNFEVYIDFRNGVRVADDFSSSKVTIEAMEALNNIARTVIPNAKTVLTNFARRTSSKQ